MSEPIKEIHSLIAQPLNVKLQDIEKAATKAWDYTTKLMRKNPPTKHFQKSKGELVIHWQADSSISILIFSEELTGWTSFETLSMPNRILALEILHELLTKPDCYEME